MKKYLSIFLLVIFIILNIPISAFSQIPNKPYLGLVISPSIKEFKAKPGDLVEGTFRLTHDFQEVNRIVTLYSLSQDFTADGETGNPKWINYKDRNEPKIESSMEDWISYDKDSFVLDKQGKYYDFKFKIVIPEYATGGTHQSGIIFTETPVDRSPGANRVGINAKLAGLVFVEVEGTKTKELTIDEIKVNDIDGKVPLFNLYEYLPVNIELKIQNNGNVNIAPSGDVFISTSGTTANTPTLQFNEEGSRILAKSSRVMKVTWLDGFFTISKNTLANDAPLFDKIFKQYTLNLNFGKPFRLGAYDINVKVNYTDANNEFKSKDARVTIFILPWKMILLVILLIVIYIIIRKIRSSRKKHVYKEYREIPYEKKYSKFIDE